MEAHSVYNRHGVMQNKINVEMTPEEFQDFCYPGAKKQRGVNTALSKSDLYDWITNQGNYFYFLIYRQLLNDFPDCEGLIFKFVYLCTYGDYSTNGGLLIYNKKPLVYKDFYEILMLSEKRTDETIEEMINKELLYIDGENYKPNPKYYLKGNIGKNKGNVTRIFNKGMQELYTKSSYREHNLLAHFIPLLPYVNLKYNILCKNPEETDIKKLQPFNLKDICDFFEVDQTNSTRLKRKLLSITVHNVSLIGYFTRDFGNGLLKCFIVNPYVYYKAPSMRDMENISKLFDVPNNC